MSVTSEDPGAIPGSTSPPQPFPLNRIIAFGGPYIAVISGALADWLLVHVHLLGIFHTSKTAVTGVITQGVVFAVTAILTWAGHQKWLSGWQKWESLAAPEYTNGPGGYGDQTAPSGGYDPAVEPTPPPFVDPPPPVDPKIVSPPPDPTPPSPPPTGRSRRG